jgi:hypothetical protein
MTFLRVKCTLVTKRDEPFFNMANLLATQLLLKPPNLHRAYKFEECKALHMRCIELTSNFNQNTSLPRVAIHSSISTHTNPYFIALMELRSKTLEAAAIRDDGIHSFTKLKPCTNSY